MEDHEYGFMHNPCYGVAGSNSQDTNLFEGSEVAAKKPARGCPCSWVCIGLVLVGAVACVSMAVAVWSIAEVSELSRFRQDADLFHNSVTQAIPGLLPSVPATSCLQVSLYPSGYYWVRASNGSAVRMYCDVTRSCGGVTGGWMRVVRLDLSNTSTSCPSGLRERVDSGIRTCGIESKGAACPSVMFSTSGVEYTKVCGKILAYQFGTPDAFNSPNPAIDSNYVDGVSLTHGHTPRNHIWTFAAALDENASGNICECSHAQRPERILHLLSVRTIFATLDLEDSWILFSLLLIHCGMGMGVAQRAPVVPSTTLHGSTRSCHPPPVTT